MIPVHVHAHTNTKSKLESSTLVVNEKTISRKLDYLPVENKPILIYNSDIMLSLLKDVCLIINISHIQGGSDGHEISV